MNWTDRLTIIGTAVGATATIVLTVVVYGNSIQANADSIRADMTAFRAEAAADRRAAQIGLDTWKAEMQRLSERQAHVEGHVSQVVVHREMTQ